MPKQRGNNEGTICRRKSGGYLGAVSLGRDAVTGKLKRAWFSGKTRQDVAAKIGKALHEVQAGAFVEPTKVTVAQWLDTWLKEYSRPHVRPTTWMQYEYLIRIHLKPALGNIPLRSLRPEQIQGLYNAKRESGLSARTVNLIHVVLHMALKQAVKVGLVSRNATEATSRPRREKKEIRFLSPEEQERFLAVLGRYRLGPAFLLLLATGIRRGEALALRWSDLDLTKGTISVSRGLVAVSDRGKEKGKRTSLVFQEPKSAASKRTIPIPGEVLPVLKAHKAKQAEEKLFFGQAYQDGGLIFATGQGRPIHPRNLHRAMRKILDDAEIGYMGLHALRHTFATRCLEQDVHPKIVQEMLGQAQISLTLDTYSHVSMDLKRRAAAKMNELLKPKSKTVRKK